MQVVGDRFWPAEWTLFCVVVELSIGLQVVEVCCLCFRFEVCCLF